MSNWMLQQLTQQIWINLDVYSTAVNYGGTIQCTGGNGSVGEEHKFYGQVSMTIGTAQFLCNYNGYEELHCAYKYCFVYHYTLSNILYQNCLKKYDCSCVVINMIKINPLWRALHLCQYWVQSCLILVLQAFPCFFLMYRLTEYFWGGSVVFELRSNTWKQNKKI